jgi:hypothetical protein
VPAPAVHAGPNSQPLPSKYGLIANVVHPIKSAHTLTTAASSVPVDVILLPIMTCRPQQPATAQQVRPDRQLQHTYINTHTHTHSICACCSVHPAGPNSQPLPSKYDLIANVVHEGKAGQQTGGAPYKVHIQRSVEKTWYEVQVRARLEVPGFGNNGFGNKLQSVLGAAARYLEVHGWLSAPYGTLVLYFVGLVTAASVRCLLQLVCCYIWIMEGCSSHIKLHSAAASIRHMNQGNLQRVRSSCCGRHATFADHAAL